MGKRIDRAAGLLLSATGMYLFFLNAWQNIPLACAMSFAGSALLGHLVRRRPAREKMSARQARAELLRIAGLPDAEAAAALEALVRGRYPGEDCRVVPALKHPEANLNCGDVMNLWKANRGSGKVAIAATCDCEPRAALYARGLRDPMVAVVDRRTLERALRKADAPPEAPPPLRSALRQWPRRALHIAVSRPPRARDALIAALLLAMYLVNGRAMYLLSALGMMFWLGARRIQGRGRRHLFG